MSKKTLIERMSFVANSNNIKLRTEIVGGGFRVILEPAQPKSCMLFLHGAGNDALFPQAPFLLEMSKAGCLVVSIDLPGHGKHSLHSLNQKNLSTVVAEQTNKIVEQVFRGNWTACGYSMGGALCIDNIQRLQRTPDSILLIATPTNPVIDIGGILVEMRLPFTKAFWNHSALFGPQGPIPAFGPFKRGEFPVRVENKHSHYLREIGSWFSSVDWQTNLKKYRGKILSVHADWDLIAPRSQMELTKDDFANVSLMSVSRQTHFSILCSEELVSIGKWWISSPKAPAKEKTP